MTQAQLYCSENSRQSHYKTIMSIALDYLICQSSTTCMFFLCIKTRRPKHFLFCLFFCRHASGIYDAVLGICGDKFGLLSKTILFK